MTASITTSTGGAGHGAEVVVLTNRGTPCTLYGYPGLGLLGPSGQVIPTNAVRVRGSSFMFPNEPEATVDLATGAAAAFGMEWINGQSAGTVTLEVTPPNDQQQIALANQQDIFTGNRITVTPVVVPPVQPY